MTQTLDDTTVASFPGGVRLSEAKLKKLQPELYSPLSKWIWRRRRSYWLTHFAEHLYYGDSRAAVVISTKPLLIAAYTDEIDCVALLRFDRSLVSEYGLEIGSRLITVNLYYDLEESSYESDLIPGPAAIGRWGNFKPLIADFLTDDVERLAERKAEISDDEWLRTETLGQTYLSEKYARPRDGRPCWSEQPAVKSEAPPLEEKVELPYDPRVAQQEVVKRIVLVVAFGLLAYAGVKTLRPGKVATWVPLLLFGGFFVVTLIGALNLPREIKRKTIRGKRWTIKSAYLAVGAFVGAVLLGIFSELLISPIGAWPKIALWLTAFISTAAFYPFLNTEAKKDVPNFTIWTVFSALIGFVGVGLAYFMEWIQKL